MPLFSNYLQQIARINHLGHGRPVTWFFYPGMLFSSTAKWWGDFKFRATRHEGIDICWHAAGDGMSVTGIGAGAQVPAMAGGKILNICEDFLGHSIIVSYPVAEKNPWPVVLVYAHVVPSPDLRIDQEIRKDVCIASVVDTVKNPQLPPHLHLSCFEIFSKKPAGQYDWSVFTDENQVRMILPVSL